MDYIVFRVYGAMSSWGEIAVGGDRHSARHPGKSAVLGLVAAALGIQRTEEAALGTLNQAYALAVKQCSAGYFMRDYHTVQAPDSVGKFRYRTRRDELVIGQARLGTVLSTREYRNDALYVIALRAHTGAPHSLEALKKALEQPAFHLYLGRKSCPLSAPLAPQLIQADGFRAALDSYEQKPIMYVNRYGNEGLSGEDKRRLSLEKTPHYFWEGGMEDFAAPGDSFDASLVQTHVRHDQATSRQRWQFTTRGEHYYAQGES